MDGNAMQKPTDGESLAEEIEEEGVQEKSFGSAGIVYHQGS